MKKTIYLLFLSLFVCIACSKEEQIQEEQTVNENSITEKQASKIEVCHFGNSDKLWNVISINSNALTAHLQHGDVQLIDADGDGYVEQLNECVPGGDCDDNDTTINPGTTEICDGIDNNCDGNIDEGFDADADGFTTCQGDCDDANPEVNPGVDEICGNGIDDNCNGQTDEECEIDLIAYYRFNDDVTDEMNSHDGTPTNITYITGKSGKAIDFTAGAFSKVDVADADELSFGDGSTDYPFTISTFVKFNSLPSLNQVFCEKRNVTNAEKEYVLYWDGRNDDWIFRIFDQSLGSSLEVVYGNTIQTGVWYHIAATYDGSGNSSGLNIYVDTVPGGVKSLNGTYTAMENGTGEFVIGKFNPSTAASFDGYLDGLGVWSKELTTAEVLSVYTTQNQGTEIL